MFECLKQYSFSPEFQICREEDREMTPCTSLSANPHWANCCWGSALQSFILMAVTVSVWLCLLTKSNHFSHISRFFRNAKDIFFLPSRDDTASWHITLGTFTVVTAANKNSHRSQKIGSPISTLLHIHRKKQVVSVSSY